MKLRLIMRVAAAAVLASSLSGCALGGIKPADLPAMADAFAAAGCKGNVHMAAGGATASGASVGSAHAEFSADGDCDPSRAQPKTVPVSVGQIVGATASPSPANP